MANSDPNWIEHALAKPGSKGKFGAKAARAGMSTSAFASKKAGAGGALGKEANMAKTLARLRPKKTPSVAARIGGQMMANA